MSRTGIRAPEPRIPVWLLLPIVLVLVYALYRVRVTALVECDVGINAGAGAWGAFFPAVVLLAVNVGAVLLARRIPSLAGSILAILVILYATSMLYLMLTAPTVGYPSPVATCINNVPGWWPIWLPR